MSLPNWFYLLKLSSENIVAIYETCSKLTIKTSERRQRRSGVFIVNFEQISHIVLVSPLLGLKK